MKSYTHQDRDQTLHYRTSKHICVNHCTIDETLNFRQIAGLTCNSMWMCTITFSPESSTFWVIENMVMWMCINMFKPELYICCLVRMQMLLQKISAKNTKNQNHVFSSDNGYYKLQRRKELVMTSLVSLKPNQKFYFSRIRTCNQPLGSPVCYQLSYCISQ